MESLHKSVHLVLDNLIDLNTHASADYIPTKNFLDEMAVNNLH